MDDDDDDDGLKFALGSKLMDRILNKKCKIGQKGAWPRSRATSRSHDLVNKQPTEALRNGKIREWWESIPLTSNTVTECGFGFLTSRTKKAKINFKNWTSV